MDVPPRVKCTICSKEYAKSYIKRHLNDAHGAGKDNKKKAAAVKKQEVAAAAKDILTHPSYQVPAGEELTDEQLAKFLEDAEFIDPTDESGDEMSISAAGDNNTPTATKAKVRRQPEKAVQLKMEKRLGFGHKSVPYGVIDILTNHELVEIKHWDGWMKGIGQCIVYGHMYPNHMKWIHFFGDRPHMDKEIYIKTICAKLAIKVTHE